MSNDTEEVIVEEDPYATVSKTDDDVVEKTGDEEFIKVMQDEDGDSFVELPREDDGTVMVSTLQGQFPRAAGLRYKSSSGGWRGVRIIDGALKAPQSGWGDMKYYVTFDTLAPAKPSTTIKTGVSDEPTEVELLQDLFVIHLPREAKSEDLKEYFSTNCGEMDLCEVKCDRETGRTKGFGFVRFKTADAAKEAINGTHVLMGRQIQVKLSRKRTIACQLFVGRLADGTSKNDLEDHFSQYGELTEAYITMPFRGFGFVTYASIEEAHSVLRMTHSIKGSQLNVCIAKSKNEDEPPRARSRSRYDDGDYHRGNYERDYGDFRGGYREEYRGDPRRRDYYDAPRERPQHDDRKDNTRYSRYGAPPWSAEGRPAINDQYHYRR